jgi:hypothetical protein
LVGQSGYGDGANLTIQAGGGGVGLRAFLVLDAVTGNINKVVTKPKYSVMPQLYSSSSSSKHGANNQKDIGYGGGGLGSGVGGDTIIEGGHARSFRTGRVLVSTQESYANSSGEVVISTGSSGSDHMAISALLTNSVAPPHVDSVDIANALHQHGGSWYRSGDLRLHTGRAMFARAGDIHLKSGPSEWPQKAPEVKVEADLTSFSSYSTTSGGGGSGNNNNDNDHQKTFSRSVDIQLNRRKKKRRGSEVLIESGSSTGYGSVGGSVRLNSGVGDHASGSVEVFIHIHICIYKPVALKSKKN